SEDGSKCVWCTVATFGVCVSEDIAEKMKEQIPGLDCDDDNNNDDDATDDATDDKAPVTDDTAPNDDSVPGKACIEDCMRRKSDTTGGFGICMDKDAASTASKSDWFDCKMPNENNMMMLETEIEVEDPYDPSCIAATLQGDESTCKDTQDADGMACEWCAVGTTNLCLNGDQAQIAEQIGGSCNDSDKSMDEDVVNDPYDPSCIAVTLQGDETSCKAAQDADGNACEWCSVGTTELCLNDEQAQIAEQIGGSCNDASDDKPMSVLGLFF
ncbi:MAG: hypothetical protein SGILL_002454, partial [Bacillariaceae sp.]